MKRLALFFLILCTFSVIWANPIVENLISRFWFEENNLLTIELSAFIGLAQIETVTYLDAEDSLTITVNPNTTNVQVIYIPQSCNTPAQGYFTIRVFGMQDEIVRWGEGLENDLSPLNGTQCGIQLLYSNLIGDSIYGWAKDTSPSACGPNYCSARFTYRVECTNLSGLPVAGVSVYHSQCCGNGFDNPAISDVAGIATDELWPMKTHLWVQNPLTSETVFSTHFFAEPSELKVFSVQLPISVEDSVLPESEGRLSIHPSVISYSTGGVLHIAYNEKMLGEAELILYDLKGQKICKTKYDKKEVDWQLPKLANGVYFVRLTSKGRALGTAKLIVIK
ncbi:MAG: T9SS type A sorting domain-containing protein [Candidatus Cloacimonetes bacterium]|nr:T9SS type A sorting domain-containing protein [Candidatus Cloacimonadota bacterium]